jgi:protein SCO1/2
LTLNAFAEIKRQLGGHGDAVAYVFVSVDGSRDTPEVVDRYVSRFDQVFVGLTGAEDSVRELGRSLGLWFQRASSGSELEYTIDHTTDIYLIGADGTAVRAYPFDAPLTDIIADLRMELDAAGMPGIASP